MTWILHIYHTAILIFLQGVYFDLPKHCLFMLTLLTKHDMDFTSLSYSHFDFFWTGYNHFDLFSNAIIYIFNWNYYFTLFLSYYWKSKNNNQLPLNVILTGNHTLDVHIFCAEIAIFFAGKRSYHSTGSIGSHSTPDPWSETMSLWNWLSQGPNWAPL